MSLATSIYQAAHAYPAGLKALASAMGIQYDSLKQKVSPTNPNKHLSPEELQMLIELCGTAPLHEFNAGLKHAAIPLPRMDICAGTEVARAMREAGEFLTTAAMAIEDDKVDSKEMRQANADALDAFVAIGRALAGLRAMHDRAKVRPDLRGSN